MDQAELDAKIGRHYRGRARDEQRRLGARIVDHEGRRHGIPESRERQEPLRPGAGARGARVRGLRPPLACVRELLQHLLLVVTREGLHHSYFNMPVQVPDLRVRLRALCGLSAWPQILLRIGFSLTEPSKTPRRSVEEVLSGPVI